jgi:predicted extracellular nuclease
MSKKFPLIMLIFIAGSLLCAQITHSCYDIQYNPEGGSNSPYLDQVVTVQGIVSGISFYSGTSVNSYGFFIADAAGGPWSGLYIYNQTYHPNLGDLVQITGTVNEYYGLTEISQLTSFQVLSQDNPLPEPAEINSGALNNLSSGEQWESVLVKVLMFPLLPNQITTRNFMLMMAAVYVR